ncbi:cytochrome c nitrite reductase pentaheme subunit [Pasteurellaceae bacterium 22721_9_1]
MNSVLKTLAKLTALCGVMLVAVPMTASANESKLTYEPTIENVRDPNQYCAKCHNLDTNADQAKGEFHTGKFHGTHLTKTNPTTGKPINCVTCHGNISEEHRRGVKDVMRFHGLWDKEQTIKFTPAEQNQVCFSCHQPEKLKEKFWAHDVHSIKLPCADCHTLHPAKDKMKEIKPKERVKLCVDCHSEQQKQKEAREKQLSTEQKDKK